MPEASYLDALVHYRVTFPTLADLGVGNPPAAWKAALDEATEVALAPVLVTSAGGGIDSTSSGSRNFPQALRLRALHALRAELDPDYSNPYLIAAVDPVQPRRMGSIIRLGY